MNMMEVLNDILLFLETNLEAKLIELGTKYGVTVDKWKEMVTFRAKGQQYPSVSIEPATTGPIDIVPGNGGVNFARRFPTVNIVVWHRGNNANIRRIEENVTLYMDALEELYMEYGDMNLPRKYQFITITGTEPTNLLLDPASNTQHSLLKGSVFTIEIRPTY